MKSIEAHENTLTQLFEPAIRYVIPQDLQRPYVWTKDNQWEPLWQDVERTAQQWLDGSAGYEHFLGAVVLQQHQHPSGRMEVRSVIDGHQRFTTLQILLAAARTSIHDSLGTAAGGAEIVKRLNDLVSNAEHYRDGKADREFKVWPLEADRDQFRAAMGSQVPKEGWAGPPMVQARGHFEKWIRDWLNVTPDLSIQRAQALEHALAKMFTIVTIDLGADVNPNTIFETLNARGTRLLEWDITKSKLMGASRNAGSELRDATSATIRTIEENGDWWRTEVGAGRYRRPRVDEFLNHFLVVLTGEEVPRTTEARVFERDLLGATDDLSLAVEDLSALSATYRDLLEFEDNSQYGLFLHRWRTMQMGVMTPVLLWLRSKCGDSPEFKRSVSMLESYLVRRMICGFAARGGHDFFLEMMSDLMDSDPSTASETVVTRLTARSDDRFVWPTDSRLRDAILYEPLFERLTRARTRMVIEALEQHLRVTDKMTETDAVPDKLTIEHVMPQDWHDHWPYPVGDTDDESPVERRRRLIHTLGNLTLVNKRLNPSMSNAPWPEKRVALKAHSTLLLNNAIESTPEWDEETIEQRSRYLAEIAIQIWPGPDAI